MGTDLRDRLTDLAGHTPPSAPPGDLWARGVRRRRLARAGAVVAVTVVVVLLGLGTWTIGSVERRVEPAGTGGTPHLPDRIYEPSLWLHVFGGPPGQLIAVIPAQRESLLHTKPGLVGVTAGSGRYGFLDLPSNAVADADRVAAPPALSPDGLHLAFWTTGTPKGTPNTHLLGRTITGVGLYDLTTGAVREAALPAEHGLDPTLLAWSDARTLVLGLSQASQGDENQNSCCEGHWQGLATWDIVEASGPTELNSRLPFFVDQQSTSAGSGNLVFSSGGRRITVIDPEPPGDARPYRLARPAQYAVLSPGGHRIALVTGRRSGRLMVGRLTRAGAGPRVALHQVATELGFLRPIAWQGSRHVMATRSVAGRFHVRVGLYEVNVRTGHTRVLVRPGGAEDELAAAPGLLAEGLLGAPGVHSSPPPRPWDLRAIAIGLLIGASVIGGTALLTWGVRRAARP
jgi:hypothetical protein